MALSFETQTKIEADIEAEVEKRILDYAFRVFVDGKEIYIDETLIEGGEVWLKAEDISYTGEQV